MFVYKLERFGALKVQGPTMDESLPLSYSKPTICWIDDEQIVLDAFKLFFSEQYNFLSFNDPHEAVKFLQSYKSPSDNPINLADKSNEIAVLITDYQMPKLNGLEVCKQLSDSPIRKILLTGEASQEKATEAFNQGLIDKFIHKDLDVAIELQDCIEDLVKQYFYNKTSDIALTTQ